MINIIVGFVSVVVFAILIFWAFRPMARTWFEFPKYKMLEDYRRFSEFDEDLDPGERGSSKFE